MNKRWMIFRVVVGLALGLALCVALYAHLDVKSEDWGRLWRSLSWPWTAVVLGLTLLHWWSGARKWRLWALALHGEAGREPASGFFLRHIAWQNWYGQFLPPTLAIVLGRSWAARHMPGVNWRAGAGNGIYDQAMEFLLLSALLPAAWLILHDHVGIVIWGPVAVACMAVMAGFIGLSRRWLPQRLGPFLPSLLAWSALRVVVVIARLVAGAPALSLAIDWASIAATAPVVALLMIVPLTPGNLGIAEWGWVGVLAYGGTDPVQAGLMAVGFRVLMIAIQTVLLLAIIAHPLVKRRAT